jgi:hypothetical protein
MAAGARERSKNWVVWAIAGIVVALLVIGAYQFSQRAQRADLPRPADLVDVTPPALPPTLPDAPNLPPAPIPAPR